MMPRRLLSLTYRRPLELAHERLLRASGALRSLRPTRGSHLFHTHLAARISSGDALPQHAEYKFLLAERNRRTCGSPVSHLNCFAY